MLDTSGSLGVANDPFDQGHLATGDGLGEDFGFPGLMAGAICVIGLVIGVCALLAGYTWVAVAALGVAVTGPWVGLAWVSHAQRGAYNIALPSHD